MNEWDKVDFDNAAVETLGCCFGMEDFENSTILESRTEFGQINGKQEPKNLAR